MLHLFVCLLGFLLVCLLVLFVFVLLCARVFFVFFKTVPYSRIWLRFARVFEYGFVFRGRINMALFFVTADPPGMGIYGRICS